MASERTYNGVDLTVERLSAQDSRSEISDDDSNDIHDQNEYIHGADKSYHSNIIETSAKPPDGLNPVHQITFPELLVQLRTIQLPSISQFRPSKEKSGRTVHMLHKSADQLQSWINIASEVIRWLSAEGDIEWAASGGRLGFDTIIPDIKQFSRLVELFCERMRELKEEQGPENNLTELLSEKHAAISTGWQKVRQALSMITQNTELGREWVEIRNNVLSQITTELDDLAGLVFELEEIRHQSTLVTLPTEQCIDHSQTSYADMAKSNEQINRASRLRMFILPPSPTKAAQTAVPPHSLMENDTSLVKLVARLQPLQASLEFLPMRLSSFQGRAKEVFPTACEELREAQTVLERRWYGLRSDAETLRRELGEDRFILVFRNAGKQAIGMMQVVENSLVRVREVFDKASKTSHGPGTIKTIESYEAKKVHYCPAIERILALVDRGAQDRLTVNGEIIRLQTDLRQRWQALQSQMRSVDFTWDCYDDAQQRLKESRMSAFSAEDSTPRLCNSPTPSASPTSSPRSTYFSQTWQQRGQPLPLVLGGDNLKPRPIPSTSKLESGSYLSPFSPYTGTDRSHSRLHQRQVSPAPAPKPRWNYSNVVPDPKPIYVLSPVPHQDAHPSLRPRSRQQNQSLSRSESPGAQSSLQPRARNRSSMHFASSQGVPCNRSSVYLGQQSSPSDMIPLPAQPGIRSRGSMYFAPSGSHLATPPSSQAVLRKSSSMLFGPFSLSTPPSTQPRSTTTNAVFPGNTLPSSPLHNRGDSLLTPPPSHLKAQGSLLRLRSKGSSSQLGSSSGSFLPRPTFWRLGTSPEDRCAASPSRFAGAACR